MENKEKLFKGLKISGFVMIVFALCLLGGGIWLMMENLFLG